MERAHILLPVSERPDRLSDAELVERFNLIAQETDFAAAEAQYKTFRDEQDGPLYEALTSYRLKALKDNATDAAIQAHDEVVASNIGLVSFVVNNYASSAERVEVDDMLQEGWQGLSLAAWKFEHQKGFKFSTFAVRLIKNQINLYLAHQNQAANIPSNVSSTLASIKRHDTSLDVLAPGSIDEDALALSSNTHASTKNLIAAARMCRTRSLDESFGRPPQDYFDHEGQPTTRRVRGDITEAILSNHYEEEQAEIEWATVLVGLVEKGLAELKEREEFVVSFRSGIVDGKEKTLGEVGEAIGVTKERVRQIEAYSHSKMRQALRDENPFKAGRRLRDGEQVPKSPKVQAIRDFRDQLFATFNSTEIRQQAWRSLRQRQASVHSFGVLTAFVARHDYENSERYWSTPLERTVSARRQLINAAQKVHNYVIPDDIYDEWGGLSRWTAHRDGALVVDRLPDTRCPIVVQGLLARVFGLPRTAIIDEVADAVKQIDEYNHKSPAGTPVRLNTKAEQHLV